ncbi:probable CCR4-associated factor 1 homolog 9 [Miscanthus floridulus]|uniref:probable CCR4-associated factor 1 homolog 9 n=1 Tax=Miscanthus floridulus TaxID=154761 RepID=UPI00345A837F
MDSSDAASTLDYMTGSMVSTNAAAPAISRIAPRPPPRVFQPSPPPAPPLVNLVGFQIRPVTAAYMESGMDAIASLLTTYPIITIDAEYAVAVHHRPSAASLAPRERYALVKSNVDEVPIVQLGITLCDEHGNLPVLFHGHGRRPFELAWEVTFSDFDARRDRHAAESVAFLRSQGIDLDQALASGVSSAAFAAKLAAVLSASATPQRGQLTWVAFGGAYDFAYMVKMLTGVQAKAVLGGG